MTAIALDLASFDLPSLLSSDHILAEPGMPGLRLAADVAAVPLVQAVPSKPPLARKASARYLPRFSRTTL